MTREQFIEEALKEDFNDPKGQIPIGDHTTLSTIPIDAENGAYAVAKESGVLAGIELAKEIFAKVDSELVYEAHKADGERVDIGDIIFTIKGKSRSILMGERLVLNFMQRMSGIATLTHKYVKELEGTNTKILDTRKTTPNLRSFEKWAVKIGGGHNHRFGLYDMIMIKDNHQDFCGGIENAIISANKYLHENGFTVPIEIETRSIDDVKKVLEVGNVTRIMLDNFSVEEVKKAVELIDGKFETEASGGITLKTLRAYAEAGPDYISAGALTHSYKSLDISLKANK
ncbi:MAG: carboxylating nicotinate-nucleotide diphosphorylase [Chitinophagales bacterium]